ncbi:MAG: hypothetical protein WCB53_20310, partial [Terriglobales bacterium]
MKNNAQRAAVALMWLAFAASQLPAANTVNNADELLAQHLESIAKAQDRAALKSRVVQGPVEFRILVGGAGVLDGKAFLVSEGKKFQFMMKLPNNEYKGEQFIFNGDKDSVAFSTAAQSRSSFGNFMFVQDAAIREGLWGGELSTAWPLLNLGERKAKLSFEGLKKVDGQDLYEVRYQPHKSTDLEIQIYFDPQTGHHVRTIYSYSSSSSFANLAPSTAVGNGPSLGGGGTAVSSSQGAGGTAETAAARQFPNRYRLVEKFSDFKSVDGVTLPTHYDIQFSQELQNGKTTLSDWDMKGLMVSNNV